MKRKILVEGLINLARKKGTPSKMKTDLLLLAANTVSKKSIVSYLTAQDWKMFEEGSNPFLKPCTDEGEVKLPEIINFFEEVLSGKKTFSEEVVKKNLRAAGKFDKDHKNSWKIFSARILREVKATGLVGIGANQGLFRMYMILKGKL